MSKGDVLHLTFGIIGNATGLFLFLSPMATFKRIVAKKSTEQFSIIPYAMTLLNCLLAAWYGLPFITRNNYLISAINTAGVVIETTYVLIFLVFAPKTEKARILRLLASVFVLFSAIALVSIFAFHKEKQRRLVCGFALTICSIIMYASPLLVMRVVIRTKSVEYMPFLLSLCVFLCSICWLIYGLIGKDIFIIVPNSLGSVFGAMQLTLYAIYCKNKGGLGLGSSAVQHSTLLCCIPTVGLHTPARVCVCACQIRRCSVAQQGAALQRIPAESRSQPWMDSWKMGSTILLTFRSYHQIIEKSSYF